MSNNETACTSCAHKDVCKYKEDYLKVCDATTNINIALNEHYENGARTRYIPIANVDCIGYVEVHCKYYMIQTFLRASDIIMSNTNV